MPFSAIYIFKEFENILICRLILFSVLILIQVGDVKTSTSVQKENLFVDETKIIAISQLNYPLYVFFMIQALFSACWKITVWLNITG